MKHLIVITSSIFSMALGCSTDIPISYNPKIENTDIKGIWRDDNNRGQYVIFERPANKLKLENYELSEESGNFVGSGELDDVYLTSISDGEGSLNFLSVGTDAIGYDHVEYSFISKNELRVALLSTDYLEKHFEEIDGTIHMGSTENFQTFLKENMRDKSLYEDAVIFFRKTAD